MYVDLTKTEVIKKADGETEEQSEKFEKVFLAKVGACGHVGLAWAR